MSKILRNEVELKQMFRSFVKGEKLYEYSIN